MTIMTRIMLKMETRFICNLLWLKENGMKMTNQARFEISTCATNNNIAGLWICSKTKKAKVKNIVTAQRVEKKHCAHHDHKSIVKIISFLSRQSVITQRKNVIT